MEIDAGPAYFALGAGIEPGFARAARNSRGSANFCMHIKIRMHDVILYIKSFHAVPHMPPLSGVVGGCISGNCCSIFLKKINEKALIGHTQERVK